MKKIITVMLIAALIVMIIPCAAVNAEGTEPGVRFEAVREDEETLRLDVVTNVALNFGGLALARVPVCDTEVFTYTGVRSGVLSATKPNNPAKPILADTGEDLDVEANEVLFSVIYSIGEAYEEGVDYTFTGTVSYVYDYDFVPYDWEGAEISAVYSHKGPSVEFNVIELRTRGDADSNDGSALRVMYKVSFNDSFVNYKETEYGVSGENNYEITRFAVSFTRTDSANPVTHLYDCSNIYSMAEGWFLYNVTLTGIKEKHASWRFTTFAEIDYRLGEGDAVTVTCGETEFTINDYVFNAD